MHIGFLSLILAKAALIAGKFCIRTHPHLSRNGASFVVSYLVQDAGRRYCHGTAATWGAAYSGYSWMIPHRISLAQSSASLLFMVLGYPVSAEDIEFGMSLHILDYGTVYFLQMTIISGRRYCHIIRMDRDMIITHHCRWPRLCSDYNCNWKFEFRIHCDYSYQVFLGLFYVPISITYFIYQGKMPQHPSQRNTLAVC